MKRIALLFVCAGLVASAQEVRITRAALLRSERTMISLGAGTIVDLLSRSEQGLTVRFNRYTGTIPADSLVPAEKRSVETKATAAARQPEAADVSAHQVQKNTRPASAVLAMN